MKSLTEADEPTAAPPWPESLVELYRDRYDRMVRLAYLLTGDGFVADELVQDAFVAVHRSWGRVDNPNAYLRTAVANTCRSWLRRQVLERDRRPAPPPDAALEADELWDVMSRLPERQRIAIVLRFYEGTPDAEIAEILGCRVPTVRTSIHRGLAAMRREIVQ